MRSFRLTKMYHSEYSVADLLARLRMNIGNEWEYYQLVEESDNCFTMKPNAAMIGARRGFIPIVDVLIQKIDGKVQVVLSCRPIQVMMIASYIFRGIEVLMFAGMLASKLDIIDMFPLFIVICCSEVFFGCGFLLGALRHCKLFTKELKLTPINKDSKGEN